MQEKGVCRVLFPNNAASYTTKPEVLPGVKASVSAFTWLRCKQQTLLNMVQQHAWYAFPPCTLTCYCLTRMSTMLLCSQNDSL